MEVGKYRIVGQVGEGAMGVVYRALDPVLNRTVAIKVMADAVARDDDLRSRFLREAQAAGSLQHPNVVTIYDFGEVDGHLYIAMEFVDGDDLDEVMRRQRQLTTLQKIDIIIDVLSGLSYAHKRGIVHRDIKPANIRIDEDGRARIMDFGIAHLSSSTMTKTGVMVGTPAYMAPEQIVGTAVVPATDLFSVGAVTYELLTGKKPFAAESLQGIFYKIVSTPPADVRADAPELPAALNDIVQKALAKEPADRYASALDMANALTSVRAQVDSLARRSGSISLRSQIETGLAARPAARAPKDKGIGRRTTYIALVAGAFVVAGAMIALRPRHEPAASGVAANAKPTTMPPAAPPAQTNPIVAAGSPTVAPPTPALSSAKPSSKPDVAGARDLAVFQSMQATALDSRRRAADAGATNDQLTTGDDHNRRATALAADGKVTEAAAQLNLATTAWFNAERDARAAASAPKTRVAEQPKTDAASPAPVTQSPGPAAAVAQSASAIAAPPPPPAPVANPSAEIANVIAAYARAIDSRNVNEVRRAFPGATSEQTTGFDQFFSTVKSLHATLTLNGIDVQGSIAEGRVTGAYDYVTTNGKAERQPLDFQASFRRDGSQWKLVAVRANR